MQAISVTTQQVPKPSGVAPGEWHFYMIDGGGSTVRDYVGAVPSVVFADVPNGTYTIFAERLATDSSRIGPRAERVYTVTDGEMVDVPLSILVGGA